MEMRLADVMNVPFTPRFKSEKNDSAVLMVRLQRAARAAVRIRRWNA
jgi:hypothetical protein